MTRRIMVIDDDSNLRLALKYRFEREEYIVQTAADGFEALEKVRAERPDLIILDLAMPKMNGLEFLSRLRDEFQALDIPVVVLTAVGLDGYRGQGDGLRIADLIMKPFDARRLIASVEEALANPDQSKRAEA